MFGITQVEYLGHIISEKGVATDSNKIKAMIDWPIPTNVKQLRGFLGLTSYYRKFVKGYAVIAQPLTSLLKKGGFQWSEQATLAFKELQQAMIQSLVLAMPDFEEEFVIETDASGYGELLVVVLALQKWRGYLLDRHFKIRTNHFSLKYVLDQRITTPFQSKWLPKLLGFDYEIEYKKGKENMVADALLRVQQGQLFEMLIFVDSNELIEAVKATWVTNLRLKAITEGLQQGIPNSKFTWPANELRRKGKLVVGNDEGGVRRMVKQQVHLCDVCQRNKSDLVASPGLLQPLKIPERVWKDISMDFIEALPMSQGYTVIMVVVDMLSKYAHFIGLSHPFTAAQVAQALLDNIYKLHGLPSTIVSDRTKSLLVCFGSHCSRCMTGEKPKEWMKWLSLAKYWYNSNFHNSIKTTPFEVVYGQSAPIHIPYKPNDSTVDLVDRTLQAREQTIDLLKFNLKAAQDRMKSYADKKRSDREFDVGDFFYGPFKVLDRIGKVAYKLELPPTAQFHSVFHVSQLKRCHSKGATMGTLPLCDAQGLIDASPLKLLDRKMVKQGNRAVVYGLIQWTNGTEDDATWELLNDVEKRFPDFDIDP
ncbi:retrotransposon-related protein [Tanacetum coccineum]